MIEFEELYESRLIILLETAPQTNKYMQILLNKEEFKKVSEVIANLSGEKEIDGRVEVDLKVSDEEITLPENINSIN